MKAKSVLILVIAAVLFVFLPFLLLPTYGPPRGDFEFDKAFNSGCSHLRNLYNCSADYVNSIIIESVKLEEKPADMTLSQLCSQKLGNPNMNFSAAACARVCGCPSA